MHENYGKLMTTAGYIAIGIGFYLIYKGGGYDKHVVLQPDDIIEAEYTIIED